MDKLNVHCIIVTYNAMKWIDKCLGSLRTSSVSVLPIIIDNCSTDESVNYITANYPEAHIIKNKKNKGFGQANNQGIEYAYKQGATHFFLLNQDAWVHNNTIEKLVQVQDSNNFYIVSPIHLNGKGDSLDNNYFSNIVHAEHNLEFVSDLILNTTKPFYEVSQINAAAWLLSKNTIENIGGFDPIFFHYGEDGNYCQRVKYHNGDIVFVPESFINHDRLFFGNQKVYNERRIISELLYHNANINYSLPIINVNVILLHFKNLKRIFNLLVRFKFKELIDILKSYFIVFLKIPEIFYSKKKNKIVGPTWLNLE